MWISRKKMIERMEAAADSAAKKERMDAEQKQEDEEQQRRCDEINAKLSRFRTVTAVWYLGREMYVHDINPATKPARLDWWGLMSYSEAVQARRGGTITLAYFDASGKLELIELTHDQLDRVFICEEDTEKAAE